MFPDVTTLQEFYRSPLGRTAAKWINHQLTSIVAPKELVLGLGYPVPFIDPANAVIMMPAQQGVAPWPRRGEQQTGLCYEDHLPFADCSISTIVLSHVLENTEYVSGMLRECWRVLSGNGQLVVLVPGRRGVWARFERTPFGYGHPYTMNQLRQLLRDNRFQPEETRRALYFMPMNGALGHRSARVFEKLGPKILPRFAGVNMMTARKEVFSPILPAKRMLPRLRPAPIATASAKNSAKDAT